MTKMLDNPWELYNYVAYSDWRIRFVAVIVVVCLFVFVVVVVFQMRNMT